MATLVKLDGFRCGPDKPHLVFVHGLGGDLRTTWMSDAADPATLWPRWVGEDSGCPTWLLGYDAALSGWEQAAMPLPQQGTTVLDAIVSEPELQGVPLVMVGHSLGGLVIKQALANSMTQGVARHRLFADQLKGVVFVATPSFGADLASLADAFRLILRTNLQARALTSDNAWLGQLNSQFRESQRQLAFSVRIFAESRGVTLKRSWFGVRGPSIRVVSDSSGDPGVPGEVPIVLPADHFSICKPASRSEQIHKSMLMFLKDLDVRIAHERSTLSSGVATPRQMNPVEPEAPPPKPAAAEAVSAAEASFASDIAPRAAALGFARAGFDAGSTRVLATACVVSAQADELADAYDDWKARVMRDSLVSESVKLRVRQADLLQLAADPALGARLLDWLCTTAFSGYVYYAPQASLAGIGEAEQKRRFFVQPLVHRLSKKNEQIADARGDAADVAGAFEAAARAVKTKYGRSVTPIDLTAAPNRGTRTLVELARLVAEVTSAHLSDASDEGSARAFDYLRTRVRFAMDISTGITHTRDNNPLI